MAKTDRLYIRITPEMKEALQELAAADGRSLSNYIENLLRREIERHAPKQEQQRSCRNCNRVCIEEGGGYKDIEGGCEKWVKKIGK